MTNQPEGPTFPFTPTTKLDVSLKQILDWDEKAVDRMLQNQRPMTILAAAALSAVVWQKDVENELSAALLGASVLLGVFCHFTGEQFFQFVGTGLYGHADMRLKKLRFETLFSQLFLLVGCTHLVSGKWAWLSGVVGAYSLVSAHIWGLFDPVAPNAKPPAVIRALSRAKSLMLGLRFWRKR